MTREGYIIPVTATDLILEYNSGNKQGLVLIERLNVPYGMALPGGFQEKGYTFAQNAIKEGNEETGLEIHLINSPNKPFTTRSQPFRDPREHHFGNPINTLVYRAQGSGKLIPGRHDDAKEVYYFTLEEVAELAYNNVDKFAFADHADILREYFAEFHPALSQEVLL